MSSTPTSDAEARQQLRVSLSTSSLYPAPTSDAFEAAARLGYDGVEVMVGIDEVSTDPHACAALASYHEVPIVAIHAPTLLLTQRVWGTEAWGKLHRAAEMAHLTGAGVIVVHPPFRWQRDYARGFVEGIAELEREHGLVFAVENMYPWRTGRREFQAYLPDWNPVDEDYDHVTLDLSHSATAGDDALAMARELGPRLAHLHLADGAGSPRDEHLVPGRGSQPCREVLELVADSDFDGEIVVEINTRKSGDARSREVDLLEALAFARLYASR